MYRAIHCQLNLRSRIRRKVHKLLPHHIENRKTNSKQLLKLIQKYRPEYVVTLDGAKMYLSNGGKTRICYLEKGEDMPEEYLNTQIENFDDHFMVVAALTSRSVLPLIRVPKNVKINAEYYVNNVLRLLLENELPKLYPNDLHKVFVHHDLARSKFTRDYAKDIKRRLGITIINNRDILVKSPDDLPLNFLDLVILRI